MAFEHPAEDPLAPMFSEAAALQAVSTVNTTITVQPRAHLAVVAVNVTAVLTVGTLTVSLQRQDANGIWHTLGTTAAITAVGTAIFSVGPGTANGHPLGSGIYRIRRVVTGDSVTHQVSVQAR